MESGPSEDPTDVAAQAVIERYAKIATGAMIAIPVPGVDIAATFGTWAKMIWDISRAYGHDVTRADALALTGELFKNAVLTGVAWYASAKTATTILKFIPWAGTITAYLIDAIIAAWGARRITRAMGLAAAIYFKSGRQATPQSLSDAVKDLLKHPDLLATLIGRVRKP